MQEFGFYCSNCGLYHKEIPMAYGAKAPYQYFLIPENETEQRCILTQDQCIIDDVHYFIKGRLELLVNNREDSFIWNVWVEISKIDFDKETELWDDENRILIPPYTGVIDTQLSCYSDTLGLPVQVITQPVGITPLFIVKESSHPLFLEQESGINMNRVVQFAKHILYNHG